MLLFQEKGTEKWLYGLDDINEAAEVIIVHTVIIFWVLLPNCFKIFLLIYTILFLIIG